MSVSPAESRLAGFLFALGVLYPVGKQTTGHSDFHPGRVLMKLVGFIHLLNQIRSRAKTKVPHCSRHERLSAKNFFPGIKDTVVKAELMVPKAIRPIDDWPLTLSTNFTRF